MLFSLPSFRAATTILGLTILAGCSSKKEDATPTMTVGMSWTVDGGTVFTTTLDSENRPASITVSGIVPGSAGLASLSLGFPKSVGTYTFDPTASALASYTASASNAAGSYYAGASGSGTVTGAGTIVVTALSATTVTGTFTFTGINPTTGASKSITNGMFNVRL